MSMTSCLRPLGLVLLLAAAWPVAASNLNFMDDAPVTHFTDEDAAMFRQALSDSLERSTEGEVQRWKNPATRAEGDIKVTRSFVREDLPCRTLKIHNKAKARSATGNYTFCKQPTGRWVQSP